ncbi:hypothetical protein [Burkholderia stagnalis]|uniref:hypothetical protein n=1 Tax=Burkholderia stagnalis TaxID=1503054 RepID=UPI000A56225B|nr:hypothetical protein [Burkholderia stagnalis]
MKLEQCFVLEVVRVRRALRHINKLARAAEKELKETAPRLVRARKAPSNDQRCEI